MKKYNALLSRIAEEYNILKGDEEQENSWKVRIIYSVAGRMGFAAMSDFESGVQSTSIRHIKQRISNIISHYEDAYPEIGKAFDTDGSVADEIYNVFLKTGQMYHMPDRVLPAMPNASICYNIKFTRGLPLSEKVKVSGVGTYDFADEEELTDQNINDMFQLQKDHMQEQWEKIVSQAVWSKMSITSGMEFLRVQAPFSNGYWEEKQDCKSVTLCRIGANGNQLYYLCKKESNELLGSQLPVWLTDDYNYRSLACGCLLEIGTFPPTTYHVDGGIVIIKFGYLPSPPELNLIKLYSWPLSYWELPHDFNRIMTTKVFFAIKPIMEEIGYQFIED